MRDIVIIAHDIRSAHNVGALLRTADGFGAKVYLTGYTPYPLASDDQRLPHISNKLTQQIHKTALGAEGNTKLWSHNPDIEALVTDLRDSDYKIVGLEQARHSIKLPDYHPPAKVAMLLGREVEGIETDLLKLCDEIVEIPMVGAKESFNVTQAATAALYHCRFYPF